MTLRLLAPLLLAALAAACTLPALPGPTAATPPTLTPAEVERQILAAANAARRRHGAPPLAADAALAPIARAHAADMAARNYFEHVSPDGRSAGDRVRAAGYAYERLAENLYWTTRYRRFTYTRRDDPGTHRYEWFTASELADATIQSWLDSPGHRANLLNPALTHAGVGVAFEGDRMLVAMKYSRPR